MSSTIAIPGLGSGLDVNTIINGLVTAESAPLTAAQTHQTDLTTATTTVTGISTNLGALQAAASALSTAGTFNSCSAASSDGCIVATASGGSTPGSYDVVVNALAYAQRTYSNPQTTSTTALGMSGSLSITGATTAVSILSTDSLTDIAQKISSSGARVSASVLFDGTQYRLQVRGLDSGAANVITFGGTGATALGLSTPANTIQKAVDSSVTIDNVTITRPTNQLTDVIPGATLALVALNTAATPTHITIASDPSSVQTKLQAFVKAYNDVVTSAHKATGYGSAAASSKVLKGDPTIRSVLDRLSRVTDSAVPGATGAYRTLGSVGIALANDGTLTFDTTKFATALTADPASVQRLFVKDATTGATGAMDTFSTLVNALTTAAGSPVLSKLNALGSQAKNTADHITKMQARITAYQTQLQKQFTTLDSVSAKYKAMQSAVNNIVNNYPAGRSTG